ncbi:MAG: hypothetical protein GX786_08905 [Clostridiales bacterium]|nr:hypothetical protein [Clostridiales bacterium]
MQLISLCEARGSTLFLFYEDTAGHPFPYLLPPSDKVTFLPLPTEDSSDSSYLTREKTFTRFSSLLKQYQIDSFVSLGVDSIESLVRCYLVSSLSLPVILILDQALPKTFFTRNPLIYRLIPFLPLVQTVIVSSQEEALFWSSFSNTVADISIDASPVSESILSSWEKVFSGFITKYAVVDPHLPLVLGEMLRLFSYKNSDSLSFFDNPQARISLSEEKILHLKKLETDYQNVLHSKAMKLGKKLTLSAFRHKKGENDG